jgi:hypothetical protein
MSDETKQETVSNLETIIEVDETTTEEVDTTKEIIENTMENDKNVEPPVIKKKKAVRKPKQVLDTSDENIKVVLKSRKPGPKKKIVYVYKEDVVDEPIQIVEKIKRKAGRPKKEKLVKYVDEDGNEVKNRNESKEVVISVGGQKDTPMSEKELKVLKLEERLAELESISGKKVLITKKKAIDKRQSKVRSPAQIAAAERLVALNKQRRADKLKNTEEVKSKVAVKAVLNELSETARATKKKIEEKQKIETEYYNKLTDPLYN